MKTENMLSSDLKAAIRNILRNRIASIISILGLGIGLGCIIILLALMIHEKSFDKYIPGYRNVYRIVLGNNGLSPYPLPGAVYSDYPEVKGYFRFTMAGSMQVRNSLNTIVREYDFGFADSSIYSILGIRFISGNYALSSREVALSESAALRYFGNLSPLGSVLKVNFGDGFTDLAVSGVYKDFPSNSTLFPEFIADILLSEKLMRQFGRRLGDYGSDTIFPLDWRATNYLAYLVLDKKADPVLLAGKMERYKEFLNASGTEESHYRLQPVADLYLGSEEISGMWFLRQGNADEFVYYEIITVLILVISVANYILLTRAGIAERAHELGTRKTFGATRAQIKRLILVESNLVVIISLLPPLLFFDYGLEFVNATLDKTMTSAVFLKPALWPLLISVVLFTGIISGWLIGLYYSKIPALDLVAGKNNGKGRPGRWNYSFLVLHFTIFIVLFSGVITFSRQLRYSTTELRGIDPKNVLVSDLTTDNLRQSFRTICLEIEKIPGVIKTAGGSFIPPFGNFLPINLATTEGENIRFDGLIMGQGLTELLGMEVIDGTSFGEYKQGVTEVLLNESAAKENKVKAGEKLLAFMVKGIVRDFHAHSMHTLIQPMVILQQNPERMGLIAIKTDGTNDKAVISRLNELYNQISPDEIVEVQYLSERVENFYSRERNQSRIIGAFTIIAGILSIMGLFGISTITILKKRREISLRKVNGASRLEILSMVNADFLRWLLISVVIAVPISIFLLKKWLAGFAYRTELDWWIFAAASVSAIAIAILTVSWQSWSAATRNPVESLRYE